MMRGHASLIAGAAWPAWLKGWRSSGSEKLSGRLAIPGLSLIGLIVAMLAIALWASPSAAMVHGHGPAAHATITQAAPERATHDCQAHGNPAQAGCCGVACSPSLALLPIPALLAGLPPAILRPDRTGLAASCAPDVLSPPPKA